MKKLYLCILLFPLLSYSQNLPPVAVADSAETLSQVPVTINVLLNDYDPEGDTIEIRSLGSPWFGQSWQEDSMVTYVSGYYSGRDSMSYRVHEVNNHSNKSEYAYIFIDVLDNPDVPFARNDTFTVRTLEPTILDVLANDGDPSGDELFVGKLDIISSQMDVDFDQDSSRVIFTSNYNTGLYNHFSYYNREKNTVERYISNWAEVFIHVEENPELLASDDDEYEVTGGINATFDVLANDYDPLGDSIEFYFYTEPSFGQLSLTGNIFKYTAGTSYAGPDSFKYRTRYKNKPWLYSDEAQVNIQVQKNPDCPIGAPDHGAGMAYTPISVDVLSNDYDLNEDSIEIKDARTVNPPASSITFSGDTVVYTPAAMINGKDSAFYRVRKINDTAYYSEWIPIYFEVSHNPEFPLANPDYIATKGGVKVSINILQNDDIPDSTLITNIILFGGKKGSGRMINDSIATYTPYSTSYGKDSLSYILMDVNSPAVLLAKGNVYVDIINNHSYDSLYINNINAGINASGMQFCRIDELLEFGATEWQPHFEVPKGSGKHTIFSNTLWIGGLDDTNGLHVAADMYRQSSGDFQPGPVSDNYDSAFFWHWYRTWKLSKDEVEYHRNNWWKAGYEPIANIAEWPGNGDPEYEQGNLLAPYYDRDNNEIYEPLKGDYPLIRGDQCIFFITNDDKPHDHSEGVPLRIEIHGMAYAFNAPDDSILNNTIFMHYDLINRSELNYHDVYFGIFNDSDLGYAWDDYVGSHVEGGSFLFYNGYEEDGSNEPEAYGSYPPAQSITVLAGPFMDADMQDNTEGGCNYSVNGLNFGNGVVDDERYGLTRFTYFGSSAGVITAPVSAKDFYLYMKGYWRDNSPVMFGGYGHPSAGAVGPACRFMFPGDTDPMNWGTDCALPNGGYNQNGLYWTEEQMESNPDDRLGLGFSGPFTFAPGDVQEVDLAYVYANSYQGADSSRKLLYAYLMELRERILDGEILVPNEELGMSDVRIEQGHVHMYPNPSGSVIYLKLDEPGHGMAEYRIYSTLGKLVKTGSLGKGPVRMVDISDLQEGFYFIQIRAVNSRYTGKFIKY